MDYIPLEVFEDILGFLHRPNAIALRLMWRHGFRISDLLGARWEDWEPCLMGETDCVTYVEAKTKKERTIWPKQADFDLLLTIKVPGSPWLFPGRDPQKHRTRQAVWKDLHEVARLYRVDGARLCRKLGTHTARKIYAVGVYRKAAAEGAPDALEVVRADLNHSDKTVTFLYALADAITASRVGTKM